MLDRDEGRGWEAGWRRVGRGRVGKAVVGVLVLGYGHLEGWRVCRLLWAAVVVAVSIWPTPLTLPLLTPLTPPNALNPFPTSPPPHLDSRTVPLPAPHLPTSPLLPQPPLPRPGRDPRFDSGRVASQAEKDVAARRYAFVYDDVLAKERTQLKARLKREGANNPRLEASLRNQLQRVEGALRTEEARRRRAKVEESVKAKQREASAEGKGPFYLKKSDKKKMELVAKWVVGPPCCDGGAPALGVCIPLWLACADGCICGGGEGVCVGGVEGRGLLWAWECCGLGHRVAGRELW